MSDTQYMDQTIRYWYLSCLLSCETHARIQRGGQGIQTPPPLKKYKNIGFLAMLVRIPRLPSQYSMLGHHWPASETPFKWRFAGGLMMPRFEWMAFRWRADYGPL